jgi:hypothetical protein
MKQVRGSILLTVIALVAMLLTGRSEANAQEPQGGLPANNIQGATTCPPDVIFGCRIAGAGQVGWWVDNRSANSGSIAMWGRMTASAPGSQSAGVHGQVTSTQSANGYGVWGSHAGRGTGVYGTSSSGTGVVGIHTGESGAAPGVLGITNSSSTRAVAVQGIVAPGGTGELSVAVRGINNGSGLFGFGIMGTHAGGGTGVYGYAPHGVGVHGWSQSHTGVSGYSETWHGVSGSSTTSTGVDGRSTDSIGVYGRSTNSTGVHGVSSNGHAGYFSGPVHVQGTLSKAAGSFKIDHPLDPTGHYLSHSFVESPDMMNVYNGNVTTDANGDAVVTLPAYFEALNRDFRYQLTVIGQFAQAIVGNEIQNNQFTVKTDKPNVKVSWQVTGIRQDPWANDNRIQVEEPKPQEEQGTYLYPQGYGQPESKGRDFQEQMRLEEAGQLPAVPLDVPASPPHAP